MKPRSRLERMIDREVRRVVRPAESRQTVAVHQESNRRQPMEEKKVVVQAEAGKVLEARVRLNLVKLRHRTKMTQEQVAAKAGISVSYVSMLERGSRSPPLTTIAALAATFGVTPDRLLR